MTGIYKITNPKGRIYIGQSVNLNKRKSHYKNLECVKQIRIYNSLLKYGWENHKFEILTLCYEEQLNEFERDFQEAYDVIGSNGMNCKLTKVGDRSGRLTQETKDKIIKANTGRKHTEESKKKMSESGKGKIISQETRERLSKAFKGKKHSEETIKKCSLVKLGELNPMYGRKGKDNPGSKKVIDVELNIIYDSLQECCEINNLNPKYMSRWLTGARPNKTKYKYL